MNKLIRRFREIGPVRFIKKATFYDEVYAVGIRPYTPSAEKFITTSVPFTLLKERTSDWMADPLLFTYQGDDWLFVEVFEKATHRGSIGVIDLSLPEEQRIPRIIIRESYHMSFPMVFEWNDEVFMVPETSENHSINLYRTKSFPYEWELVQSFPTVGLIVDSVILKKTDHSSTFLASETNPENELLVRFMEYQISKHRSTFTYSITSHRSSHTYTERNGGVPLHKFDQDWMVTQNSSEIDYGVSISISSYENQKLKQRETYDSNTLIIRGISKNSILGIHTYSRTTNYEVIDIRYLKFDPLLNLHRIQNHIKKHL